MTQCAAKPQGALHNRSFTAIHQDQRTKICRLTWHFTIGSSSPLRGAATCGSARRPRLAARVIIAPTRGSNIRHRLVRSCRPGSTGHHRPYEGQQHRSGRGQSRRRISSHHRPYEGQQHDYEAVPGDPAATSSSPLRGAATGTVEHCTGDGPSGHHRPCEGQQPGPGVTRLAVPDDPSSSPLRGAATSTGHRRAARRIRSSSPLRGAATSSGRAPTAGLLGHHRPYEGQQLWLRRLAVAREHVGHHRPCEGQQPVHGSRRTRYWRVVIIAPARGSNSCSDDQGAAGPRLVIIAPTRGSNIRCTALTARGAPGHHRPYEGQQPHDVGRASRGVTGHHRPYEGQQRAVPVDCGDDGHHRPCEGQQPRTHRTGDRTVRRGSSSPLRGAATADGDVAGRLADASSSPLRGAATRRRDRGRDP